MQNNSLVFAKSQNKIGNHRRTHSSSDYDISNLSKKRTISPKVSSTTQEISDPTENLNMTQMLLETNKKKNQESNKEYIIEPLDMTPEQQRILSGNSKYNNDNLNFGKNIKNFQEVVMSSPLNQLFFKNPTHNKEVADKYRKQLEEQKISTILEKNDILSNEDSSFYDFEKLSPINRKSGEFQLSNRNSGDFSQKNEAEKNTFRKKKFHSNSQDLNIEKNLLSCGKNQIGHGHVKNSPSQQQVFTIYLKNPEKNEKQLDKIIHFLALNKKVPELHMPNLQSKTTKSNKVNDNYNQNYDKNIKDLEKRVFNLENQILNLTTENFKLKQNNSDLMMKLDEMGGVLQVYL